MAEADIRPRALKSYDWRMKYVLAITVAVALTACSTMSGQRIVPTQSTIARIESGKQLVRDLGVVGAYGDPAVMNAESRVRVRLVTCTSLGANAAMCSYEANRCLATETDSDGDGWCFRTTKFVRIKYVRVPFDVIVRGWASEQPPSME